MAKKDTHRALLRRIDETTAMQLADAGLKIGTKKIDQTMLVENYGLKPDIADGVLEIIKAGSTHGKERFLSKVLLLNASRKARSRKSVSSASAETCSRNWQNRRNASKSPRSNPSEHRSWS